jgi:drug/metabolite transporter (DMT)-like permease
MPARLDLSFLGERWRHPTTAHESSAPVSPVSQEPLDRPRDPRTGGQPPARDAATGALVLGFAALYLLWGGTYLAIRIAVAEFPPLLLMAIRCLAGALLLATMVVFTRRWQRASAAQWRAAIASGTVLFAGCHGLLAFAERQVSSGHAALHLASIPMFMVLLQALHARRAPAARDVAALATGVAGILVLTLDEAGDAMPATLHAALLLSALAWAAGSLMGRGYLAGLPPLQQSAMQLAAGGVALAVASLLAAEPFTWAPMSITVRGAGALLFLVVGGTAVAFTTYTWLLRETSVPAVGSTAFVTPVVALVLAAIAGDGVLTARTLASMALVVGAVALLVRRGGAAPRRSPSPGAPSRHLQEIT